MSVLTIASRLPARRWQAGGLAVAVAVTLAVAGPTGATAAAPTAAALPAAGPPPAVPAVESDWSTPDTGAVDAEPDDGRPALTDGLEFTLLTGDVVRMVTGPDGAPAGEVVQEAGTPGDVAFKQVDDQLYALPGEAMKQVADGRLDMELFNLTKLAEYGYDDASIDVLPVIATHQPHAAASRRALPAPAGARRTGRLDSIDAQALAVDKERAATAWEAFGDRDSSVEKVWLDAKVEVALDESVPAVGAPAAWDAGFDGTGTTIAVLDTGIDLTHPDVGAVDELTYEITDANGDTTTATVQVAVAPKVVAPDAPAATDDTAVTRQDSSVTIPVLDNDLGNDLQIASDDSGLVIGAPDHGTVTVNDDHTVTYTPDAGHVGDDPFQYVVTDTTGEFTRWSQIGTVNVTVGPSEGPIAVNDLITTQPDTPATITVLDNDTGESILLTGIHNEPDNGTATMDGTTITYTPDTDFLSPVVATKNFIPGASIRDRHGHGTHVASTAAGSGAASDGQYRGVAPGAELLIGKVCDGGGLCPHSAIIEGMEWAAAQGADVVNMSLGGSPSDGTDPTSQAVNRLSEETSTLFVVAAGNLGHGGGVGGLTVSAPGTAARALTVGSVGWHGANDTGRWSVSNFSGVGPRQGDFGIKPEIVAPGENIVAARAAWTFMGSPVDGDYTDASYTAADGTSMATPHVAGAAAILAQQHPDWSGQQIKNALVGNANRISDGNVTWQGGGLVDVAGSITSPLLATSSLHLGRTQAPHPDTIEGQVTLRNVSGQAVDADLSLLHLRRSHKDLVNDEPAALADGAISISPSKVSIQAGESTVVTVTVQLQSLPTPSAHYGWIGARVDGEVAASTLIGWTKEHELHRLSIRATDRAGKPAHTTGFSWLDIFMLDSQELLGTAERLRLFGYWVDGVAYVPSLGADPLLPKGRYMVLGNISDWSPELPLFELSETVIALPEVVLDRDRSFTFDAREANRIEFRPPNDGAVENPLDELLFSATRTWEDNGQTRTWRQTASAQAVYAFPSAPAEQGTFDFTVRQDYLAEDLTMTVLGERDALHPVYPSGALCRRPHPGCNPPFTSQRPLEVIDGGKGTPAELDSADVAGKLVLVSEEPADHRNAREYASVLRARASAAREAGAAGILYGVSDVGPARRVLTEYVDIPVAVLPRAEADRLAATLERDRPVRLRTGGEPSSPYVYQLAKTVDHIPTDTEFEFGKDDLATVHARYHSDEPGTVVSTDYRPYGYNFFFHGPLFNARSTRTEYVVGGQPHRVEIHGPFEMSVLRDYAPGEVVNEDIMARPVVPGSGTARRGIGSAEYDPSPALAPDPFKLDGGGLALELDFRAADGFHFNGLPPGQGQATYRFRRDGETLCQTPGRSTVTCQVGETGRYEIDVDTQGYALMPASTNTTWQVDVEEWFTDDGKPVVPPLVEIDYDVDLSLDNTVTAGSRGEIRLSPGYQPGYDGDSEFTLSAWISHDDGQTWTELGTEQVDEDGQAEFTARTPKDAKHASLRVRAQDEHGNSVDQTLVKAWDVTARGPQR